MTWLRQLIHRLQESRSGGIDIGRLRAHLEGENAPRERDRIETALRASEALQAQANSLEARMRELRLLSSIEPPAGLWDKIERRLDALDAEHNSPAIKPEPKFTLWRTFGQMQRLRMQRLRWAPVAACSLLIAAAIWLSLPSSPNYHLIEVSGEPGFDLEAENYVAHHDLSGSPAATRELLIAHYTDWPE